MESARAEIVEKFAELAEELDVLGFEVDGGVSGLEGVWGQVQEHRREADAAARKTQRRRIVRTVVRRCRRYRRGCRGRSPPPEEWEQRAPVRSPRKPRGQSLIACYRISRFRPRTGRRNCATFGSTSLGFAATRCAPLRPRSETALLQPLEQQLVPPRVGAIGTLTTFIDSVELHRQTLGDPADLKLEEVL